ncbi:methionine synthase [Angustibacter sp. Root456]|uniref:methionine synthase n=1 Tax=Angustibacter sp. Root456 TaxID=1736539 RepID=UPI000700FEB7|nr:methionine synthase [Angustibacter sp. Root456]KQX69627.1 methionine synthase [Angustibacter sp. Root456]
MPAPAAIATGIGSWPGTDVGEALAVIRGELEQLPHLPELPARGQGADLIGRAAARLVGLAVDLQPSGWRLVDRPGRDLARAQAFWREDLERLAEAFDGYAGRLKVQLAGPWTLAASLQLPRGERALTDAGAVRDLVQSSRESGAALVAEVARLVPGADVVLQLDEPSLPAVLDGRLPTVSGYGRVPAIGAPEVREGLAAVLEAARDAGASTVVHCCAEDVPIALLRDSGAGAVSLDVTLLDASGWESVAAAVEAGVGLWAGALPTVGDVPATRQVADVLTARWRDVGLPVRDLAAVVVTPTCGLAGASPAGARAAVRRCTEVAAELTERALA